jgi:outer membrane protein assembly factor BamA
MHSILKNFLLPVLFLLSWGLDAASIQIHRILIEGNRLTREEVIRRELRVKEGDSLLESDFRAALMESKQNLINTALFNFVEYSVSGENPVTVIFKVTERWYLWPAPVLVYEDRNFSSWLEKRDFHRLSYGALLSHHNLFGRRQWLDLTGQWGYNRQLLLLYRHPGIDSLRRVGLELQGGFQQLHEMAYAVDDGRELFLRNDSEPVYRRRYGLMSLIYRPGLHGSLEAGLGYEALDWSDTLLQLNPGYSGNGLSYANFIKIRLRLKIDYRDYASYPLKGWYSEVEILKHGLGNPENGPDEFQINVGLRRFYALFPRSFLALGYQGRYSATGNNPYYLNHALGYGRDFVRGYEQYVVEGRGFSLMKGNVRYELLPPKRIQIPGIKAEYFSKSYLAAYLNLHADAAYVNDPYQIAGNKLANQWLLGYGAGLDLVSYYDMVLRLEYSINRMNEKSFNIHFMAPI